MASVPVGEPQRVEKPWGHEVWWAHTDRYAGKLLFVDAGHALSLQFHREKDECSYLLSGRLRLTQGPSTDALTEQEIARGQGWRNEPGTIHSIEALEDSVVLEVSTPQLEDVVRLQDRYGRAGGSRATTERCSENFAVADGFSLRLLAESDAEELHNLIETNRAHLARWLPWAARQTFDETVDFIRRARLQLTANDGFQTAIALNGGIVGMVGFPSVDWINGSTRIGYWLAKPYQGRGIVTPAVGMLTQHAFSVWKLNRVEIQAAAQNARSRAIPERLDFRHEGMLRQAEQVNGVYLDSAIYSMLARDWPTSAV